jgi:hypothetical protein
MGGDTVWIVAVWHGAQIPLAPELEGEEESTT